MKRLLCAVGVFVALPMVLPAAGPDPSKYYVESITYGGTGCPLGSVGQTLSSARVDAVLGFDRYVASSGSGVPVTENGKGCSVSLNIHVPEQAASGKIQLEVRGYAQTPADVSAEIASKGYLDGEQTSDDTQVTTIDPLHAQMYSHIAEFPIATDAAPGDTHRIVVLLVKTSMNVDLEGSGSKAQVTTDYHAVRVVQE